MSVLEGTSSIQDSTYVKLEVLVNMLDEPETRVLLKAEHQNEDTNERMKSEPQQQEDHLSSAMREGENKPFLPCQRLYIVYYSSFWDMNCLERYSTEYI